MNDPDRLEDEVALLAAGCGVVASAWQRFMTAIRPLRDHNGEMYCHSLRVGVLSHRLAAAEGADVRFCLYGGCGHDVGKCTISNELLRSKKLGREGFEVIKGHARAGFDHLRSDFLFSGFVAGLHHLQREEGYGIDLAVDSPFPLSPALKQRILGTARLVMVADFYDALTTRTDGKRLLNNPGDRDEQRAVMDDYFPGEVARLEVLFG